MKPTIEHLLVATDLAAGSVEAIEFAGTLARGLGARLHLVHVLEEPFATSGPYEWHLPDTPARREQRYQQALDTLGRAAAAVADLATTTLEVRSGTVTEALAKAAVDYGADLIVLGTRGRAGLRQLFAGDAAERLQRLTRCPVLTINDRATARPERGDPQLAA